MLERYEALVVTNSGLRASSSRIVTSQCRYVGISRGEHLQPQTGIRNPKGKDMQICIQYIIRNYERSFAALGM